MRTWDKDPQASLPWQFNWTDWMPSGDSILSEVITVDAGLTASGEAFDATRVNVTLAGGTLGVTYKVACRITTVNGLIDERTIGIRITDR